MEIGVHVIFNNLDSEKRIGGSKRAHRDHRPTQAPEDEHREGDRENNRTTRKQKQDWNKRGRITASQKVKRKENRAEEMPH